jgi:hypothetical protein
VLVAWAGTGQVLQPGRREQVLGASGCRVRLDRRPADAGQRREPGQHRGEGDVQTGALRLVLGVPRDEALGGIGAGVPAAEGTALRAVDLRIRGDARADEVGSSPLTDQELERTTGFEPATLTLAR